MRTAAYARYSSDSQREASLEDQLRNVRAFCVRAGWPPPAVFTDSATSGTHADRAGYRAMLSGMADGAFEILLVDDLSRLSRDSTETGKLMRRLAWQRVRLIGVSDGTDTSRDGHELDTGIRSVINEHYSRDLGKKTHRGLTGRALEGSSAGGLPYGYSVTETGKRAIREDQAEIVRRIYSEYLAGRSPRTIAAGLNADGVPAPRGATWAASAIRADRARGIGILANPIYAGEQVWNRSCWVRHPDTRKRVRQERPPSEWIVRQHPELAIIDRYTWDAAQRRVEGKSNGSPDNARQGRPPRHLLSGILRCGECGGPMVVVDRYRYGCARAKESGICSSRVRFDRANAERVLLAGIRDELLSEEGYRAFQREATAALKRQAPDTASLQRALAKAKDEHGNIMAAIKAGIFTASTKAELEQCERVVIAAERALATAQVLQPARIIPQARAVWKRMADDIAHYARDVPAARTALRALIGGEIRVTTNENGDPIAEIAASTAQINVVAGAGFALSLTSARLQVPLAGRES